MQLLAENVKTETLKNLFVKILFPTNLKSAIIVLKQVIEDVKQIP